VNVSVIGVATSCAQAPSASIEAITGAANPAAANRLINARRLIWEAFRSNSATTVLLQFTALRPELIRGERMPALLGPDLDVL
jgi:hypothetical protein